MARAKKAVTAGDTDGQTGASVLATDNVTKSTEQVSTLKYSESDMVLVNQFAAALLSSADLHRVLDTPDVVTSRLARVFQAAVQAMEYSKELAKETV